jgi:hypothetical protein
VVTYKIKKLQRAMTCLQTVFKEKRHKERSGQKDSSVMFLELKLTAILETNNTYNLVIFQNGRWKCIC